MRTMKTLVAVLLAVVLLGAFAPARPAADERHVTISFLRWAFT